MPVIEIKNEGLTNSSRFRPLDKENISRAVDFYASKDINEDVKWCIENKIPEDEFLFLLHQHVNNLYTIYKVYTT